MNKAEAEIEIVDYIKRDFAKSPPPASTGGLGTYLKLERERPDLIRALRHTGSDSWQAVSGIIIRHKLLP